MEHKLKILSKYYEAILQGKKTFEVRKDDRPFSEGDTLLLQECVTPNGCGYTGREMTVDVTYILRDSEYVKDGYCIMGIKIISTNKSRYYNNKPSRDAVLSAKADVQPVKHGYWEEVTEYGGWGDTHYRCSVCGEEWYLEDGKPKDNNMNFCPRCGAKMDAEPDEPWQSE